MEIETRKILAAPGKHIAVVKANGAQVRSKRGALCITEEGLLDEATKTLLQRGPVAVEWSDFYARAQRDGDLVVVTDAAKPAPGGEPSDPVDSQAEGPSRGLGRSPRKGDTR